MDHYIKYYSIRQGAHCTATITDEGYKEMEQKYETLKEQGIFSPDMEINCAEDYMKTILSFNY